MFNAERFPYAATDSALGEASLMPQLPLVLEYQNRSTSALGLLDTGATVNVLPYHFGIELGAVWQQELATIRLSGNLAQIEACPLIVSAVVGQFDSVRLAFAWTRAETIPLILGQVNFFMEFDVCFYRSQQAFEVHPKP